MTLPPMIRKGARRYVVRVVLMVLMVHVVRVVRVVHVVHVVRVVRVVRVVHVWYMWYVWYVWYILTCSTCGARGTCGTYGVCGTCGTGGMCTVRTHACCYCLLLQELCEGDLMDFTRKVRDMLYGPASKMADDHVLAPILLVRACLYSVSVVGGLSAEWSWVCSVLRGCGLAQCWLWVGSALVLGGLSVGCGWAQRRL